MNMWLLVLPAAPLVWMLLSPRSMWRRLYAWQFRNPAAVEPSDDGYRLWRCLGGLGLILLVILGTVWEQTVNEREARRDWDRYWDETREYEECLRRHYRDPRPAEVACVVWSPEPLRGRR